MAEVFKEKTVFDIEIAESSIKSEGENDGSDIESNMEESNKEFEKSLLNEVKSLQISKKIIFSNKSVKGKWNKNFIFFKINLQN